MPELSEAVRLLVDRSEIEELIAAYSITVDRRDFAGWQGLFAPDGGYGTESHRIPQPFLAEAGEQFLASYPRSHHFFGPPSIAIDGDEASATCAGISHHVSVVEHPSQSSTIGGWMRFTLRRTDAGWRIASATAEVTWTEGGDYLTGAGETATRLLEKIAAVAR